MVFSKTRYSFLRSSPGDSGNVDLNCNLRSLSLILQRTKVLKFILARCCGFVPLFYLKIKRIMDRESKSIYHERQRLQFCLLHSLNNLYQEKDAFTRAHLNAIAEKLDLEDPNKITRTPLSVIFKPHHNVLTGNYDINVLIAALEERGKSVIWHDRRCGASSIDLDEAEDKLFGIILNVPVTRYGGLWSSRHWIALRRIRRVWYNLDSDFTAPHPFQNTEEIRKFLDGVISTGGEVLLVKNMGERERLEK